MTDCPTYIARDRLQLGADGGKYGNVGCTPGSFSRSTDGATCGAFRFSGAEIRAASSEPIPDPQSPGLNMEQGDDAVFRLTHGDVNFDTRRMYPSADGIERILGGEYAVMQYQRSAQVAMGKGGGKTFGGGHAASVDGVGGLHVSDNLIGRFPVTPAQMTTLMGSLVISGRAIGRGSAYLSFGPDNTIDWHVQIPKHRDGARHGFGLWVVDPARRLVIGRPTRRYTRGLAANCTSARRFAYAGDSQSLVVLTSGGLAREAADRGVIYAVHSGWAVKGAI